MSILFFVISGLMFVFGLSGVSSWCKATIDESNKINCETTGAIIGMGWLISALLFFIISGTFAIAGVLA